MEWRAETDGGDDMNSHAIGIFDSGLGGLTAVRELKKLLPEQGVPQKEIAFIHSYQSEAFSIRFRR